MNTQASKTNIAASIWFLTCGVFAIGWLVYFIVSDISAAYTCIIAFVFSILFSLPVFIFLLFTLPWIKQRKTIDSKTKLQLLYLVCFISTMPYAVLFGLINSHSESWLNNLIYHTSIASLVLFLCSTIAISIIHKSINNYFLSSQINNFMEQNQFQDATNFGNTNQDSNINPSTDWKSKKPESNSANKILFKGFVTGALILLMLIPTVFVSNLVSEREKRQQEVVKDVTNGWSTQQTLSGPYLYIPYQVKENDELVKKHLYLLPENLNVSGTINPEIRPRSIYKILLYRSDVKTSGNFKIQLPKDIETSSLQLSEAKICYGFSDFKGIEEK